MNLPIHLQVGVTGKYGVRYGATLRKSIKKMEITQVRSIHIYRLCTVFIVHLDSTLPTPALSVERCVSRQGCDRDPESELTVCIPGLGEANGGWNLALQGLQEDHCWRSLDCVDDGGCHCPKVCPVATKLPVDC